MRAIYSVHVKGKPCIMLDGIPYTKQNVVAVQDRVRVVAHRDGFFGGDDSKGYRSRIMLNPTWGQLFRCFQSQIRTTKDYHHAFLEGATVLRREVDEDGVSYAVVELLLGS